MCVPLPAIIINIITKRMLCNNHKKHNTKEPAEYVEREQSRAQELGTKREEQQ
jgi:hypothetical protein